MALFKIITEDENGNKKLYADQEDLIQLINYVYNGSIYFEPHNMFPLELDGIINQMLYLQSRTGKKLHRRALHFVLSFDTGGWEWQMVQGKVCESIHIFYLTANTLGIDEYQCCAGVHDTKTHRHIHFIVNPVSITTNKILHYNTGQYKRFLREFAWNLFSTFRIVLEGINYVNKDGHMKYIGENSVSCFPYENRRYPYQAL